MNVHNLGCVSQEKQQILKSCYKRFLNFNIIFYFTQSMHHNQVAFHNYIFVLRHLKNSSGLHFDKSDRIFLVKIDMCVGRNIGIPYEDIFCD